jgi:uncharacterized protein involved in response to NO
MYGRNCTVTGVPLQADRYDVACYVLMFFAAMARVFGPMRSPARYAECMLISAALWSAAYGRYVVRYAPIPLQPRHDGRPG